MELYWPQHKVFFLANLALFPDKLTRRPIDPWFFRPYFGFVNDNSFDSNKNIEHSLEWAAVILNDYQDNGYITYAAADGLYKITRINVEKATRDLTHYLKKWQQNKLVALGASKPPDVTHQKSLLLNAIVLTYNDHHNEPRVTLEDVYGRRNNYSYEPPFWEVVLSYQLLDNKVKIVYMDYERREDGLYDDGAQPVVDLEIVDEEQVDLARQRIEQKTVLMAPTRATNIPTQQTSSEIPQQTVTIGMNARGSIYAELPAGGRRLLKEVRRDSSFYNFMNYMLGHQNQDIPRGDINSNVSGCKSKKNMTDLAMRCGFTKDLLELKPLYFGGTTKTKVRFKAAADLSAAQVELLLKREVVSA